MPKPQIYLSKCHSRARSAVGSKYTDFATWCRHVQQKARTYVRAFLSEGAGRQLSSCDGRDPIRSSAVSEEAEAKEPDQHHGPAGGQRCWGDRGDADLVEKRRRSCLTVGQNL